MGFREGAVKKRNGQTEAMYICDECRERLEKQLKRSVTIKADDDYINWEYIKAKWF